ncbi:MAG: nucleotidyltransferase substrate binding protein [Mycoplasmataceae bacterium RV_VA103A]|nr:MAG: nucleotidyltransferase substrate binding protein [Mycoplasmataceae bacterium RV_VA103A]
MKKILNFHSIEVGSARDVFREATKVRLITEPERWLSYLDKRNITVHCYQEEILNDLFSNTAKEFLQDLDQLLDNLAKEAKNYAPNGR